MGKTRNAEAMENVGVGFLRQGVHFIDGDHKGLAGGAQKPGEFFVERHQASLAIHDQDEQRGLLDGHVGLAQDFLRDQGFVVRDDAAGVNDLQGAAAPFGSAIDAVAGDAGLVGDDGAARAGETVEERGLAHVGAPTITRDGRRSGISIRAGRTMGAAACGAIFQCSALRGCADSGAVVLTGKTAVILPRSIWSLFNTMSPIV